jgi:hypothetical protein
MAATTSSGMPQWTSEDIKATLNKFRTASGGREWGYDVFYCPVDLFEYIADITFLYKSQPDSRKMNQDAIQKAILLGHAIRRWDSSTDPGPRRHMVEVWRLGALLYLIRLFRLPDGIFNTAYLNRNVFRHADAIPSKTSWRYSTCWPLLQAGLLLTQDDIKTKNWLRNELYTNFRTLGCLHPKLAAEALEKVWRSGRDQLCDVSDAALPLHNLIL